jgi:hypothetical protein
VEDRYDYLQRAYRLSRAFAHHEQARKIAGMMGRRPATAELDEPWFIGRVLRATSEDDRRLRSKHAAALTYASIRRVSSDGVSEFIQEKGGFNRCAKRLRSRRAAGLC